MTPIEIIVQQCLVYRYKFHQPDDLLYLYIFIRIVSLMRPAAAATLQTPKPILIVYKIHLFRFIYFILFFFYVLTQST